MKLEQQVCTLEQAKRLKELGVDQDISLFEHVEYTFERGNSSIENRRPNRLNKEWVYSAFTVAELGQMLPNDLQPNSGRHWSWYHRHTWKGESVGYSAHGIDPIEQGWYDTEAEARAAMLIHLLETKTITAEQVNERLKNG